MPVDLWYTACSITLGYLPAFPHIALPKPWRYMKRNSCPLTAIALLATILVLIAFGGCGKRLRVANDGSSLSGDNTDLSGGDCEQPLGGELLMSGTPYVSMPVTWYVRAWGGCASDYKITVSSDEAFKLSDKNFFQKTYGEGTRYSERVAVAALNSDGTVTGTAEISSATFSVGQVPANLLVCQATASPASASAYAIASRMIVGTRPTFNISISATRNHQPVSVMVTPNVAPAGAGSFGGVPSSFSTSPTVSFSPFFAMDQAITLEVIENGSTNTTTCIAPVSVVPQTVPQATVRLTHNGIGGSVQVGPGDFSFDWDSDYAMSCSIKQDSQLLSGLKIPDGHVVLPDLTRDISLEAFCYGYDGMPGVPTTLSVQVLCPPTPSAPNPLVLSALSTSKVKLTWTNVSNESDYRVLRRAPGGTSSKIAVVGADTAQYINAVLSPSTTYEYQVIAHNGCVGSASSWQSITLPENPSVDLKIETSDGPVTYDYNTSGKKLTWIGHGVSSCSVLLGTQTLATGAATGAFTLNNLVATADYKVSCTNGLTEPSTVEDTVHINVNPPPGAWVQVAKWNSKNCSQICGTKTNVKSPDGHYCTSGELVPTSAHGIIVYHHKCWPHKDCRAPQGVANGGSVGRYCYGTGQKHDNDNTDRTVGCYCR